MVRAAVLEDYPQEVVASSEAQNIGTRLPTITVSAITKMLWRGHWRPPVFPTRGYPPYVPAGTIVLGESKGAHILINSSPEIYESWLREVVNRRRAAMRSQDKTSLTGDSLLFINAWNEWGEGTHWSPV